jgi:hypothetical protein
MWNTQKVIVVFMRRDREGNARLMYKKENGTGTSNSLYIR